MTEAESNEGPRLRLAVIGWGAIARTTARLLGDAPVDIVAVAIRDPATPRPDLPPGVQVLTRPDDLAGVGADLVIEAAGRDSVAQWAPAALGAGIDFVVSSVSAFADADLLRALQLTAASNNARIHVQPGALGAIDALAAAREMGIDAVEHRMVKPPRAWLDTPAEDLCDLMALSEPEVFFRGSAAQAASQYPKNANSAMTTALAGIGPDETQIVLIADPAATVNRHEITAHGPFGRIEVTTSNQPLEENPKTSALAALSLARLVRNRVGPLVI